MVNNNTNEPQKQNENSERDVKLSFEELEKALSYYVVKGDTKDLGEKLENFGKHLKDLQEKFVRTLELATKVKGYDSKIYNLYKKWALKNSSDLIDKLRKLGERMREKKEIKEAFDNIIFRIMEQVRLGKRDSVYYMMFRVFKANEEKFPEELVEPFKPVYSDELFKVMIFSFLSGIMKGGKEK